VNKKEREVLKVVYSVVNRFTGMTPTNPANQKAKSKCLDLINQASVPLSCSLIALRFGDYQEAIEQAKLAESIVTKSRDSDA